MGVMRGQVNLGMFLRKDLSDTRMVIKIFNYYGTLIIIYYSNKYFIYVYANEIASKAMGIV